MRDTAPEFYLSLYAHYSWFGVLWEFVTVPTLGPQSRVGRTLENHKRGRAIPVPSAGMPRADSGFASAASAVAAGAEGVQLASKKQE